MAWGGVNFGGIGSAFLGWATSMLFWAVVGCLLLISFVIILKIKRWRKFVFPCVEVTGLGQGKVMLTSTKAGWFRSKTRFFGLWDYGGEQQLVTKDGRKIQCASSVDYHDINGKRGIVVKRKDDDPEILVPLTSFKIINPQLLGKIAPADYRDAAVNILEKYEKETMTWWQQNSGIIVLAGVIIFSLIALIIVFNFAKGESAAWREFAKAAGSGAIAQSGVAASIILWIKRKR